VTKAAWVKNRTIRESVSSKPNTANTVRATAAQIAANTAVTRTRCQAEGSAAGASGSAREHSLAPWARWQNTSGCERDSSIPAIPAASTMAGKGTANKYPSTKAVAA